MTSSAIASSISGTSMPKQPGGLQIDDELELGRLYDRQVGGLGRCAARSPAPSLLLMGALMCHREAPRTPSPGPARQRERT
jgi:hypothetical protein